MTDPPSVSPENRAIPSPQGDKKITGSKYVWVQPTGFIQHLLFHIFYLSFPLTSAISKVPVVKFYFLRNLLTSCVLKLNFITNFFSIFSICHCFIFHPSPQVFLEPLKEIQQMAHLQHVDVNKIFCNVQDLCEVKPVGHFGFLYTNSTPNIPHGFTFPLSKGGKFLGLSDVPRNLSIKVYDILAVITIDKRISLETLLWRKHNWEA